ncbi:hypothetical protein QYM36_002804 [Artemia franciscana]|uniref:10 kDa heat shock protein, mitochondrial n=1 Tax=Artemia franciscana TaxID=6661 RepID=A0AA88I6V3_ARTSF|nr:hypothetical protein QYM36_002804 [Artemia franciscana]
MPRCLKSSYNQESGALTNLVPLLDRVLVEKARSGIEIPEKAQQKVLQATVVAVGPGARNNQGQHIPVTVKVGDKVLLPESGGTKVEIEDKEYLFFKENDLLARLT